MLNFVIRDPGTKSVKRGCSTMISSVLFRLKKYFHIFKLMEPSNTSGR